MSCTKEEIERKRLAALQKRQSKGSDQHSPQTFSKFNGNQSKSKFEPSKPGPVKTYASGSNNGPRGFHPYAKCSPGGPSVETSHVPVGKVVSGTVYLISEERFEVNPSEFCTPLINIFKSLPSKNFDSKSKLWNFSIEDYDCLMSKVAPLAPHIVLGPLPQYVLKILREKITDPRNIDLSPIEATLRHKLMPFQEEGVRFAIARRGRCMIADDMGLGKTFQALAVASYYRHNWPLLIVTTSSMRETWQSKIEELLPSIPLMNIVTLTTSKDALLVADQQTEVVIVSYKITTMHSDLLKNKKFGVIIIDESHYLKSHKARCTVSLSSSCRLATRVLLLSGTPALSRPAELYTQLQLLQPGLFANYTEYGKRYCNGKQTAFGWDMSGQSNLQELQVLLQRRFLIRRTKEQVLTMLESKTRETVLLDETLLQYTKEDVTGLSQMAESYQAKRSTDKHAALITFFSETARVKIPAIWEKITDPRNIDLSPIEATLRHKLMPFQEEGVRFAIARRGRCMIADDMGLGKTFQALAVASYYRHNWPLLIVTTSSMRETWQSKIEELLPSIPLMNIVTLTTSKDALLVADQQTEVVIVSYKITTMHSDLLKNKKFGVIIIDESHYLKSHKARCTVSLSSSCRLATRVLLLSGTPALSRPAELYTQLQLLQPGLFANYTEYGKRYCNGKQTAFGWDMSGQSNLQELQVLLQRRFLIRRTKEQVLTMLESKTRETVLLDETLLQYTKEDVTGLSQMAESYQAKRSTDKHAALITFFSETARVKIPAICKYIRQIVSTESGKFLVFAHHKNVIEAVCSTLDEANTHYICITGTTPTNIRADLVDKFQHVSSCRVGVLSVTAAGAGLTLTAASLVLFAELHWNPGVLTQAESRAHRLGQTSVVRVRYLLAAGTADTFIWPMLQGKLNVLNDVGLSGDTFEDSVVRRQESNTNITQYLTPTFKNKNEYIPGTNIRKDKCKKETDVNNKLIGASEIDNINNTIGASETDNYNKSIGVSETDCINKFKLVSETDRCEIDSFSEIENVFDEEMEQSFLDDNEGDEILANLDL